MTQKLSKTEQVLPGVSLPSGLAQRLKDRIAIKNEDKILETIETIKYHYQKIEELKALLENLTNLA